MRSTELLPWPTLALWHCSTFPYEACDKRMEGRQAPPAIFRAGSLTLHPSDPHRCINHTAGL